MSRGRQYVTPVIVEVRPSNAGSKLPRTSSPPSPSKAVRFASTTRESRQLNHIEQWSIYHFELHAYDCPDCHNPELVYAKGRQLCPIGHGLAQDVAMHVYHQAGEIYSTKKDGHRPVRVEIPRHYDQLRGLLKAMDRALKSSSRTVPIISYDRSYPVDPRRTSPEHRPLYDDGRREVIIEPANSERDRRSKHKSRAKPRGYKTVVVQDNLEPMPEPEHAPEPELSRQPSRKERRGSHYERDIQRQQKDKNYRVEIREPERERGRRRDEERRRDSFWP